MLLRLPAGLPVMFVFWLLTIASWRRHFWSQNSTRLPILFIVAGIGWGSWQHFRIPVPEDCPAGSFRITEVSARTVIGELRTATAVHRCRFRVNGFRGDEISHGNPAVVHKPNQIQSGVFPALERARSVARGSGPVEVIPVDRGWIGWLAGWSERRLAQLGPGTLTPGFLLADASGVSYAVMERFREMGIAHLFAASGLHLGLLYAITVFALRALLCIPVLSRLPEFIGSLLPAAGGMAISTVFLLVLDIPLSLLRAWIFLALHLLHKVTDHHPPSLHSAILAAVIIEAIDPLALFAPGFILSFGVTAGIIYFAGPVSRALPGWPRWLTGHIAVTLAASLSSLFLSAVFFHQAGSWSLLYNFLLVPVGSLYLMAALIFLLSGLGQDILHGMDHFFLIFAEFHDSYIARIFSDLSAAGMLLYLTVAGFIFIIIWLLVYRKRRWHLYRYLPMLVCVQLFSYIPVQAYHIRPDQEEWFADRDYLDGVFRNTSLRIRLNRNADLQVRPREFASRVDQSDGNNPAYQLRRLNPVIVKESSGITIVSGAHTSQVCVIRPAFAHPARWQSGLLSGCSRALIIAYRKDRPDPLEWRKFLSVYGLTVMPDVIKSGQLHVFNKEQNR